MKKGVPPAAPVPSQNPAAGSKAKHNYTSGAISRIRQGLFGLPTPLVDAYAVLPQTASIYHYTQAATFFPGAQNWSFEPNFENPLQTLWGHAFIRNPNVFNPQQPPQIMSQPNVVTNGIGGLEAGQMQLEPLLDSNGYQAIYSEEYSAVGL